MSSENLEYPKKSGKKPEQEKPSLTIILQYCKELYLSVMIKNRARQARAENNKFNNLE